MARYVLLYFCCWFLALPLLAASLAAEDETACSEALLAKEQGEDAALELLQRRASSSSLEGTKQQSVQERSEVQNDSAAMLHHIAPALLAHTRAAQGSNAVPVVPPSGQARRPSSESQDQGASPKEQSEATQEPTALGNRVGSTRLIHGVGLMKQSFGSVLAQQGHSASPTSQRNSTGYAEQVPRIDGALTTKEHLRAALAAYALWPSLLAVGVPILLRGFGIVEVALACTFWLLVRPAVGMLKAAFILGYGLEWAQEQPAGPSLGFIPEAMAASAHFYWAWALAELAVRRRPLLQRIAVVLLLGILLLPVPLAQVALGHLGPHQVTANALLGDALGIFFFLFLRLPPNWCLIQALPTQTAAGKGLGHLHDNLSSFWGGCCWPAPCRMQQAHKDRSLEYAEAATDEAAVSSCEDADPRGTKDSLDEDFVLVCRSAALPEQHLQETDMEADPAG
eukprot:TRINITY_DN107515_c0_g1_i1.p1 TRINITY_DN107515_c0_g1~~TRINITY_DN107515_c0_g1_i1.p1  ORF type:complete len:453 (+),score=103.71 TRINITY_DN107515_c0_g1_i1:252-1610(+)